ncbi:MAG: AraC family transcriptional regulator ligand-binding domain-containing protein [Salibacteraceae bacterium]
MAFNGRFVSGIIEYAAQRGANSKVLFRLSGHSRSSLELEGTTLSTADFNRVMQHCIQMVKDPCFGLHVGESMNLSAAGLISQIVQTSSTLKVALEHMAEFANLSCQELPVSLHWHSSTVELRMTPSETWWSKSPEVVEHTAAGVLAFTVRQVRTLARNSTFPLQIGLMSPSPKQLPEYRKILEGTLQFGQPYYSIALERHITNAQILTQDYRLLQLLVRHAKDKLAEMHGPSQLGDQVKRTMTGLMKPQFPNIDQVAMHMNLSVRSMQRKLKEEDTSFKQLKNELRQDFAFRYLSKSNLSMAEIAYILDYASPSAFNRSFKRWTGQTPSNYRGVNS